MALPTRGQADWDDEVASHVAGMEAAIAAADARSVVAASDASYARQKADEAVTAAAAAAALLDDINQVSDLTVGYIDHGSLSGAVSIDSSIGTHVLEAMGPTSLTLAAAADGAATTILVESGASDVTFVEPDGVELTDGGPATFLRVRGEWRWAGSGGSTASTDTSAPSDVTGLSATGGALALSAAWSASTDAESTVSYRYRYWLTSGGATGAWQATSATTFDATGVPAGAYTVQVYSSSAGGQQATPTSATATVSATADATPPTAGTLASSSITDISFVLTVSGASDNAALAAAPYAFSTDNGATYTAYQTSATYTATGKTASTAYQCIHRVKDSAGNVSTGTAITVNTTAAWTPASLTGLAAWWDASDATTFTYSSGSVVSQWRDKSGNARHLSQATTTDQPSRTGTINGKSAVLFDGTSDYMASTAYTPTKPTTLLAIARNTAASGQRDLIVSSNPEGRICRTSGGTIDTYQGSFLSTGVSWGTTNAHSVAVTLNGASSKIAADSGAWALGDAGSSAFGTNGWHVGKFSSSLVEYWQGEICEIIHVNAAISDADKASFMAYAAAKWGTA